VFAVNDLEVQEGRAVYQDEKLLRSRAGLDRPAGFQGSEFLSSGKGFTRVGRRSGGAAEQNLHLAASIEPMNDATVWQRLP